MFMSEKVQPTMRAKTDDGKDHCELWFILEGHGPNEGSVLEAFCKCKGEGIEVVSTSPLLFIPLKHCWTIVESVTSDPCLWVPKPQSSTQPCEAKDLNIVKTIPPSSRKKKGKYTWVQIIEFDPRQQKYRKVKSKEELASFTKKLSTIVPSHILVILPLLQKFHLPRSIAEKTHSNNFPGLLDNTRGIMLKRLD